MARTREGIEKFSLSIIREEEKHVLEELARQKHKSEYIKNLITKDLLERGVITQEYLDDIENKRIEKALKKKKKTTKRQEEKEDA